MMCGRLIVENTLVNSICLQEDDWVIMTVKRDHGYPCDDIVVVALRRDEKNTEYRWFHKLLRVSDEYLQSLRREGYTIYPFSNEQAKPNPTT